MHFRNCLHEELIRAIVHIHFSLRFLFFRDWFRTAFCLFLVLTSYSSAFAVENKKPDKVVLQLKWKHQFQFAGYYAAEEKGYYKEAGLDVTIVEARPGMDPAEEVLAGRADFGVAGSSLVLLRDKAKPVIILAAIFQHSPLAIMMKDDGSIADVQALAGKTVMIEPLSSDILAYLQIENVNIDSMKIVPHTFDVKDLIDNKVDAMTAYTTTEPYYLRKLKIPYKLFQPHDSGVDFYGDCLFTTEKQIKLHPDRVKAFREASLRGWKYAMDHPEEMITTIRWKYDSTRSKEQLLFEAIEMRALIKPNVIEIGYMNTARWQQIVETYKKSGQISHQLSAKSFLYSNIPVSVRMKPYYALMTLMALLLTGFCVVAIRFKKLNSALKNEIELRDLAENNLKETKSIFETAFDQSPAGIIIADAPDGNLRYINKSARKILGNPADRAVVGMDSKQFTPGIQLLYLDGVRATPVKGPLARAILHGESISKEFISHDSDKVERFVLTNAAPIVNDDGNIKAGVAIVVDITERKKAQMALIESEKRFQSIADTAPMLLWMTDTDCLCTYLNLRWLEFTGRTMEQEAGYGWSDCVHPEDYKNCLYARTEAVNSRQPFIAEYRLLHHSGEYRWVIDSGIPRFNATGEFLGFIGSVTDITYRKIAEEKLQESENRLSELALQSGTVAWEVDSSGMLTYMSHVAESILGYRPDELVGHFHFYDLHPESGREEFKAAAFSVMSKNEPFRNLVNPVRKKDGHLIWVSTNGIPMLNPDGTLRGYRGSDTDITERKRSQDALIRSEARFRSYFDLPLFGVTITSSNKIIMAVNPAMCKMLGYTEVELVGMSWVDTTHPDDLASNFEIFNRIVTGEIDQFTVEKRMIHRDGHYIFTQVAVQCLRRPDRSIDYFVSAIMDITERKRTEDELIKAKERAEESDRLKSAFLSIVSHEIRTPMNGIMGFAELLREPHLAGEKQQQYINIIEKSGQRLLNTITDIINISKIEAGDMKLALSSTNVNEQIEYVDSLFKQEAEKKGLRFSYKNQLSHRDAVIKADREKLYSIITVLVSNAIKFTTAGSVEFGYEKKGEELEFFVKDTGIGIPAERQKAVFERFVQADIGDSRAFQGSGLGLSIAKAYAEIMGGKIWLKSEEGKGSIFYLTIPYNPQIEEKVVVKKSVSPAPVDKKIKKLKILIAEDDETSELLLAATIKNLGGKILTAVNGTEAIELCHNNPDIDLILMDIKMPEMDGYEATRQIRQFNQNVIIIAQTAYALTSEKAAAKAAGCNDYITKPINHQALMKLITKYF